LRRGRGGRWERGGDGLIDFPIKDCGIIIDSFVALSIPQRLLLDSKKLSYWTIQRGIMDISILQLQIRNINANRVQYVFLFRRFIDFAAIVSGFKEIIILFVALSILQRLLLDSKKLSYWTIQRGIKDICILQLQIRDINANRVQYMINKHVFVVL
jgi:hypothetical protein